MLVSTALSPVLLGLWMICILELLLFIGPWGFVHLFTNLLFSSVLCRLDNFYWSSIFKFTDFPFVSILLLILLSEILILVIAQFGSKILFLNYTVCFLQDSLYFDFCFNNVHNSSFKLLVAVLKSLSSNLNIHFILLLVSSY